MVYVSVSIPLHRRTSVAMKIKIGLIASLCFTLFACVPSETNNNSSSSSGTNTVKQFCFENEPCTILPLGDSITEGLGSSDSAGYRSELFHKALLDGIQVNFIGTLSNGPTVLDGYVFPRDHEGHRDWIIQQAYNFIPKDRPIDGNPNIVLLHIGTEDLKFIPGGAPGRLEILIDRILDNNPQTLLVLSNLIPWPEKSVLINSYNKTIPAIVQLRAKAGFNIIFVDQFSSFPSYGLSDGKYPNSAGYKKMAENWYRAIQPFIGG